MVNALPVPLSWRSSLMMACAVATIAGTFSTRITTRPERLTVRMPDTTVLAVSILLGRGHVRTCWNRCREFVLTTRHQLSVAVPLRPRFFENRLNGWIGLKQRVA